METLFTAEWLKELSRRAAQNLAALAADSEYEDILDLHLRYFEGMPVKEINKFLVLPRSTRTKILYRFYTPMIEDQEDDHLTYAELRSLEFIEVGLPETSREAAALGYQIMRDRYYA